MTEQDTDAIRRKAFWAAHEELRAVHLPLMLRAFSGDLAAMQEMMTVAAHMAANFICSTAMTLTQGNAKSALAVMVEPMLLEAQRLIQSNLANLAAGRDTGIDMKIRSYTADGTEKPYDFRATLSKTP
jgi:hypothetical protein